MFGINRHNPAWTSPTPAVAVEVAREYPELATLTDLYRLRVGSDCYLVWSGEHPADVKPLLEFLSELPASTWSTKPVLDFPWPSWLEVMPVTDDAHRTLARLDDVVAEVDDLFAELEDVQWWASLDWIDESSSLHFTRLGAMAAIAVDARFGTGPRGDRQIDYLKSLALKYQRAAAEARLFRDATVGTDLEIHPPENNSNWGRPL